MLFLYDSLVFVVFLFMIIRRYICFLINMSVIIVFLFYVSSFFNVIIPAFLFFYVFFFLKQKTAYELRISDWISYVCSSDLRVHVADMVDVGGVGQVLAREQAGAADAEGAAAEEVALALGQVLDLDAGAVDVAADGDGDLAALHRELEAVEVMVGGDVAHGERRRGPGQPHVDGFHAEKLAVVGNGGRGPGRGGAGEGGRGSGGGRSEEHTSELQALIRLSYAVFCLK